MTPTMTVTYPCIGCNGTVRAEQFSEQFSRVHPQTIEIETQLRHIAGETSKDVGYDAAKCAAGMQALSRHIARSQREALERLFQHPVTS